MVALPMRYLPVLLLYIFTACTNHYLDLPEPGRQTFGAKVESPAILDAAGFNAVIAEAAANGDEWPFSPALVAFKVLGGDAETRTYRLSHEANRAESPDEVVCVVVRDGFLDDAVRGDWHKIHLGKASDHTWRIVKIQKASRCWRNDSEVYRAAPCP